MVCINQSSIFKEIWSRNVLQLLKYYIALEDESTLDHVVSCIGNIAVESIRFRDSALKMGILDRAVDLSKDVKRPIILVRSCLFLISNLFRGKPVPDMEKVIQ